MALFEVVLEQEYAGQTCINRWNYVSSGTPAAVSLSFALMVAMGWVQEGVPLAFPSGTVARTIQAAQSNAVRFVQVAVKDVFSVTDFYELPYPAGVMGSVAAEGLSPALAWGFRTNRVRSDVSRGYKRIVGMTEDRVGAQGIIVAGSMDIPQNIADAMSDVLTYDDEGNTLTFTPCVAGKDSYTTDSGRTAYRYYPDLTEQLEHTAVGVVWSPYTSARTQTSRQYGRGS